MLFLRGPERGGGGGLWPAIPISPAQILTKFHCLSAQILLYQQLFCSSLSPFLFPIFLLSIKWDIGIYSVAVYLFFFSYGGISTKKLLYYGIENLAVYSICNFGLKAVVIDKL